ncbi:MAG: hypothetical protein WBC91_07860 [Phototrophicaceae bacterium]
MGSALLFFAFILALVFGWGMFGGILQLILALILWMFIGNIAGHMIRGEDYGVAGNIALGLVGGIVGAFILRLFGMGFILNIWLLGQILSGVIGAVLLVYITRWTVDGNFGK